jgi:hypothetical protein
MKINKNKILLITLLTLTSTIFSADLNNTPANKEVVKKEETNKDVTKEDTYSLSKHFDETYKSLENNLGETGAKFATYTTAGILLVATAALIYKGYEYLNAPDEEDNFDEEDNQDNKQN